MAQTERKALMGLSFVRTAKKKHYDHPSRDPKRADKERRGAKRLQKMKFESEAQRRDYERDVASNPFNVKGLPAFYPPVELKSFGGFGEGRQAEVLPCGHRWKRVRYEDSTKVFECADGGAFTEAGTTINLCRRPCSPQTQR